MPDVVVIGGGIAGYTAALSARREGAAVTMVARAPGATALYAGAMEIVDDLEAVLRSDPHHPYSRLGMDQVGLATELDTAISNLQLALAKDGLRFEGGWRTRGLYADIHGVARPANVVPDTVAPGELGALSGKRVAVIGVPEVGDYDAASVAQALSERHGIDAFPEEISIPELPVAASLTDLYGRRAPAPRARGAAIAYPPGFTGLPDDGFELLASPPSPHGWRLQQAIGLGAVPAHITSFETSGARVVAARSEGGRSFRAEAFVLASGRHIGGGLTAGRTTVEPLLGLGVYREGRPAEQLGTRLHHLKYLDAAEQFRLGLATDRRLRPLDGEGRVPYANLYAAGAVLGYDYAGGCGFGVPILTGWLAGRYAARQAA